MSVFSKALEYVAMLETDDITQYTLMMKITAFPALAYALLENTTTSEHVTEFINEREDSSEKLNMLWVFLKVDTSKESLVQFLTTTFV